ncbi:hypothetical protein DY000_02031430 [Brassica cretica]|uniref:GTD-binding domain-containing protein n=1 Tax=Brassica cretica TaxID=69181 RepID=A0ABQ7E0F1_BRACR|nr:hypothetical protein DY000_02031430 [Brassica cretica]
MFKGHTETIQLGPRPNKAIIVNFVLYYLVWTQFFIFVRVDNASVEESCIPILRIIWGRRGTFDLLHASLSFNDIGSYKSVSHFCRDQSLSPSSGWLGHDYTPKRVRRAVALHRSRFQPDLPVEEEEDEPSMDGFVPCESPVERERSRNRKDKHIVVDDGEAELLGSNPPEAQGGVKGPEYYQGVEASQWALDASIQEVRMAQFRAKKADKEIARLRDELERSRRDEGGLVATEILRAHRRGRREMVEIMKTRRDYTVGGLFFTQAVDYSYDVENARQTRRMNERARHFLIPRIEENIWKQWEPIPVSPDTVVAETGVPDETGEVNQPVVSLTVDDYLVGESMTGYFDIDG